MPTPNDRSANGAVKFFREENKGVPLGSTSKVLVVNDTRITLRSWAHGSSYLLKPNIILERAPLGHSFSQCKDKRLSKRKAIAKLTSLWRKEVGSLDLQWVHASTEIPPRHPLELDRVVHLKADWLRPIFTLYNVWKSSTHSQLEDILKTNEFSPQKRMQKKKTIFF